MDDTAIAGARTGYNNPVYDPRHGFDRQQSVFDRPLLSPIGKSLPSFYIDHVSKVTTWEDPRFRAPSQNQAAQALSPSRTSQHAQRGHGHQGETIPMRDMRNQSGHGGHTKHQDTGFSRVDNAQLQKIKAALPTCPESLIKQTLIKHHNNYSQSLHELQGKGYGKEQPVLQLTNTPAAHLKEMFPAAPAGVIQDVLAMCSNNEDEAKDQLIDLGFQLHRGSGSTSRTVSPSHSPRHQESSSGLSPRHSNSQQRRHSGNHSHQAAPKPQISDSEKQRLVSKLAVEFPNLGKDIIQMALEATNYKEDSAKRVLGGTDTRGHSSNSRASSATSALASSQSGSSTGQHRPTMHVTNADLEPVVFGTNKTESRASSGQSSRETTPSHSAQSVGTGSHLSGTSGQQQQKARQVTNRHQAKRSKAKTSKTNTTVTTQPRTRTYVSEYRTQANGPNPALRSGPDRSLLLSDYTPAHGPNPSLRSGPDPGRVQGSQGAQGPDRSLRCGPQSSLHMGPSLENLSRAGLLVSNV